MPLTPGTKLGPYEIVDAIGAGGMGEVYKAHDPRLDRTVAIKVLPGHLGDSEALRQRFDREARTISSLNHPHICTLYDVGHEDGVDFLVMEYLEGESLGERLARDRLSSDEMLTLGLQISEALDKAHRSGVVHRDLKPGNVMLTKGGAKLLDFGLAKMALPPDAVQSSITNMPTEQRDGSKPLTAEGSIVGTFQYMAPEQLEGGETDARSDIFALGAVLYEMATGKKAFEGKSQASLIAAILERDPPMVSTIEPMSPPALDHVIRACLAKDPEARIQTAHDVSLQLRWIKEGGSQFGVPAPVAASRRRSTRLAWAAAAVLAIVSALLAFNVLTRTNPVRQVIHAGIVPPPGTSFSFFGISMMSLSPDGTRLAFVIRDGEDQRLWIRPLASSSAQALRGTDGATFPFWSPDSRYVCFFASGKLRKIDVEGGAPITLCNAPEGRGGSWGSRDVIVFAPASSGGLSRVPASGGQPVSVVEPDTAGGGITLRWPVFLPDGEHFLYISQFSDREGIFVSSTEAMDSEKVLDVNSNVAFVQGHILYVRENVLMAQPFDTKALKLAGDGFAVADPVQSHGGWSLASFTVSATGLLVYNEPAEQTGSSLRWYERDGRPLESIDIETRVDDLVISRDGKYLAAALLGEQSGIDNWTYDLERKVLSRLTFTENADDPVFSPDGRWIAFAAGGDLYRKRASGAGEVELLHESPGDMVTCDWSPDGSLVLYMGFDREEDLWALPVEGGDEPFVILKTPFRDLMGQISPDGRWLAYASDESGDLQVYVQNFPDLTEKWQISRQPATMPRWRADGKELLFVSMDRQMKAVSIDGSGSSLVVGDAETLFEARIDGSMAVRTHQWVMSPDAQRFLFVEAPEVGGETVSPPAHLLVEWMKGQREKR